MAFNYLHPGRLISAPLISERWDSGRFALGVAIRSVLLGMLALGLFCTLFVRPAPMSALVLAGLGLVVTLDLARFADKADRVLSRFVSSLEAGDPEYPAPKEGGMNGLRRLSETMRRFTTDIAIARSHRQRDIEYLRSLVDTVPAAICVIEPGNRFTRLNRAAHKLSDQAALSPDVVEKLVAMQPGTRSVIRLGNGQRVQVSAAQFSAEGTIKTLVSLQNIASELDAAEIKAWQDLVRILSHEMMNSLTPIVSLAQSIRPLLVTPTQQSHAEVATAVDVIADRSQGLMNFVERYRTVADLPRPILRHVRIKDVLGGIDRLFGPSFAEHGIHYSRSIEPSDITVLADSELLEQAMINIVRNAIEAVTAAQMPSISLSCRQEVGQVVIKIADNGRGADDDVLERIFVPFFTTKPGQGSA